VSGAKPTRQQGDLAEMLEMLLDKGVVVNADITVSVGETELLGIRIRAAIASFETAAQYGLEFPTGTDMRRVEDAAGVEAVEDRSVAEELDVGIEGASGTDADGTDGGDTADQEE
jgi:L-cysteine desulfidase